MPDALEGLLWKWKNPIMSSGFQNTIYNGQKLCDFFGEKAKTRKEGRCFGELIWHLMDLLPKFVYSDFIERRNIYEKYPHLYLQQYHALVRIKDLLDFYDAYGDREEVPTEYISCSLLHPYRILYLNKTTKSERFEFIRSASVIREHPFAKLFGTSDKQTLLKALPWEDYTDLMTELA